MDENYTVNYACRFHVRFLTQERKKIERSGEVKGFEDFSNFPEEQDIYAAVFAGVIASVIDNLPHKMLPDFTKKVTVTISVPSFEYSGSF